VTEKSEAIASARRCRSSRLIGWWTQKEYSKKKAKEEERQEGSLSQKTIVGLVYINDPETSFFRHEFTHRGDL
jgi:hypothetical protein